MEDTLALTPALSLRLRCASLRQAGPSDDAKSVMFVGAGFKPALARQTAASDVLLREAGRYACSMTVIGTVKRAIFATPYVFRLSP